MSPGKCTIRANPNPVWGMKAIDPAWPSAAVQLVYRDEEEEETPSAGSAVDSVLSSMFSDLSSFTKKIVGDAKKVGSPFFFPSRALHLHLVPPTPSRCIRRTRGFWIWGAAYSAKRRRRRRRMTTCSRVVILFPPLQARALSPPLPVHRIYSASVAGRGAPQPSDAPSPGSSSSIHACHLRCPRKILHTISFHFLPTLPCNLARSIGPSRSLCTVCYFTSLHNVTMEKARESSVLLIEEEVRGDNRALKLKFLDSF